MRMTEQEYADFLARNNRAAPTADVRESAFDTPDQDESAEQAAVIQWCRKNQSKWPDLSMVFAVPNGGYRKPGESKALLSQGVRPGVPDLMLPVARQGSHGLFIEMKRVKGGRISPAQNEFMAALTEQGYTTAVCFGAIPAIQTIKEYLARPRWEIEVRRA